MPKGSILRFIGHRVDQGLYIAKRKRMSLQGTGRIAVLRNVIGHHHTGVADVSQGLDDPVEIHIAIVRVHLLKIVPPPFDVAQMNIENLVPLAHPLDDRNDFGFRVFQPFGRGTQAEVEAV